MPPVNFTGWYTDASCTTLYDFDIPVTQNITLYAGWTDEPPYYISYSVLGNYGGTLSATVDGTDISSGSRVQSTETVIFTADPLPGYQIKRWYDNGTVVNGTNDEYEIDFGDAGATCSRVVIVEYELIPPDLFEVTVIGGGCTGGNMRAQGDLITIIADNPPPAGMKFAGWSIKPSVSFVNQSSAIDKLAYFTMPAANVTATAIFVPEYEPLTDHRYTVLVLDTSASMKKHMGELKDAAKKFCERTISTGNGQRIAIVRFGTTASAVTHEFTDDMDILSTAIDSLTHHGATNIYGALDLAEVLLEEAPDEAIQNIMLMTDGMANKGLKMRGQFSNRYANAVLNKTNQLTADGINIATVGFYNTKLSIKAKARLAEFLFTIQNAGYFAAGTNELIDFLNDVKNGLTVFGMVQSLPTALGMAADALQVASCPQAMSSIWISGPVDIYIANGDEHLSTATRNCMLKTSWGTIEFFDKAMEMKRITLYTTKSLTVAISGKKGTTRRPKIMGYAINFHNAGTGSATPYYIEDVQITRKTRITTGTANNNSISMLCDAKGKGEEVSRVTIPPYTNEAPISTMFGLPPKKER